jgi:hypothetical protein
MTIVGGATTTRPSVASLISAKQTTDSERVIVQQGGVTLQLDSESESSATDASRPNVNVTRADVNVTRADVNVTRADVNVTRADVNEIDSDNGEVGQYEDIVTDVGTKKIELVKTCKHGTDISNEVNCFKCTSEKRFFTNHESRLKTYDLVKSIYLGPAFPIKLFCLQHGECQVSYAEFNRGGGCGKCGHVAKEIIDDDVDE